VPISGTLDEKAGCPRNAAAKFKLAALVTMALAIAVAATAAPR
jgi:hypothetical protein